jgi:Type I restriction enzyme R protein N terminus (HSDR_N)
MRRPLRRGAPGALQHEERKELDLVLFLNGIPIFTAELKNPLKGQDVEDAFRQCKTDCDPREPLFAYGRGLAHFAVDPDLVYVTTQLAGPRTRFPPFNQGKFGGAGNPPVPPTRSGYATGYLWDETWAQGSVGESTKSLKAVLSSGSLVTVTFAIDGCPGCRRISPVGDGRGGTGPSATALRSLPPVPALGYGESVGLWGGHAREGGARRWMRCSPF